MDVFENDRSFGTAATEDRGFVPDVRWQSEIETVAPGILDQARAIAVEGEGWIDTVARAMTTVVMADYQRDVLRLQLERARQGLPPLDASQYGVGVSVGISPSTQQLLILGGLGLLAVLSLSRR
jgi:hypothetical protein